MVMRINILAIGSFKQRVRLAATSLRWGRGSRYFEDEYIQFNMVDMVPVADHDCNRPRLNVIAPNLSASRAFGGLATQIGLPLEVFKQCLADKGWLIRFISCASAPAADDNIVSEYANRLGVESDSVSFHYVHGSSNKVPVARDDLFLGSLWYNLPSAMPLMQFQHQHFVTPKRPYISLVQDYEAGFHPWSSAYMMTLAAYDSNWPKRIIFNSSELASFYKAQGHEFEQSVTFEPVLNAKLRDALMNPSPPPKERQIIVYGRPDSRRNCFYLLRKSLEIWSREYPNAGAWRVISVGDDYDPFQLNGGAKFEVLGKLTLAEYADQLHRSAVGLSLMASPHPSYPPLEMAHFGALTVCNNFQCKDMASWHENMMPTLLMDPHHLAQRLTEACARFDMDPATGLEGKTRKPHYLSDVDTSVLQEIGELIIKDVF
jgi:hypothetical protein